MRKTSKLVEDVYQVIYERPGVTQREIADTLGITRHKVSNALPSLDSHGLLVYEDNDSKLYPLKR